jgi:hypothetical protein
MTARAIEIIDPDGERQSRKRWRIMVAACLLSLAGFAYPEAREYYTKWLTLQAARKLGLYLSELRTRAITEKVTLEARFSAPDLIEVYEVTSCGPNSHGKKLSGTSLGELEPGVEFAPLAWVRDIAEVKEPYLSRYCYDPSFGSSVFADGLVRGNIFLAHRVDLGANRSNHLVQLGVEGASGDLEIE